MRKTSTNVNIRDFFPPHIGKSEHKEKNLNMKCSHQVERVENSHLPDLGTK
jgi:hypothetical protein